MVDARRVAFGDWQTPALLARAVVDVVARTLPEPPAAVLEPTCGVGAFLEAAAARLPGAELHGYDINEAYVIEAQRRLPPDRSTVKTADFFTLCWEDALASLPSPLLILGNPPWVTSAGIGATGGDNLPEKTNFKGARGLDAITGTGNFDISEWMLVRLIDALQGRAATVALLCKTAVARRVIEIAHQRGRPLAPVGSWRIDSSYHFGASVDAWLFVFRTGAGENPAHEWPIYADLGATVPTTILGFDAGVLVGDHRRYVRTRHLAGVSDPEWRSGVKHDCAQVVELVERDGQWWNGLGEAVTLEPGSTFPFRKSSDVANQRATPARRLIVTQSALGEDTDRLRLSAPLTWEYLSRHRARFDARKSSIYSRGHAFAMFGVGPYTFAPWKVAVSGLYKRFAFSLYGPEDGRPVVLDDTCYFLSFPAEIEARAALRALESPEAQDFFESRVFWDAKRPIRKTLLQALDLRRLTGTLNAAVESPSCTS
jgi:methylase of polypeptide subunit release factors